MPPRGQALQNVSPAHPKTLTEGHSRVRPSSLSGINDGSDADADDRCCTRSRLASRVGDCRLFSAATLARGGGERGPYLGFIDRWNAAGPDADIGRSGVLSDDDRGGTIGASVADGEEGAPDADDAATVGEDVPAFTRCSSLPPAECSVTAGVGVPRSSVSGSELAVFGTGRTVDPADKGVMLSLSARDAAGRFEGVVGSSRSSDAERDVSSCCSSPRNCDMMPSRCLPHPGEPSTALLSADMRSGLGPAAAMFMTFLISASLTLMLRRLLRLAIRVCCAGGRSFTVRVGDGVRERGRDEGAVTITTDWSSERSMSERWSLGMMAGSGFSSLGLLDGAENTSSSADNEGAIREAASLGNGGTGGGKASNRGELE